MKKIFSFIITLTLILLLTSCGKTCYVTFQSNGEIYDFIEVQSGKTYRFYYRANGSYTQAPSVTLSAVFWD